jgi:hypothetical protein
MDRTRWRIVVATFIGVASGSFCFFLMRRLRMQAGDFGWAIHLAERWLGVQNPYDTPYEQYPFTAVFFGLPFVHLSKELSAGIFFGLSSAALAFGLTREDWGRLLIFLAYPYWIALLYVQWSPLIAAGAFFPLLLPVVLAKPQVGLPIFITRLSVKGAIGCALLLIASLIALPRWPTLWLHQTGNYQHFFAILTLPGPIVLLALLRYRDRDAWLLLLTSLMPQRWFFDSFILWLIPKSRREIMVTVFFSWCAGLWRWYHPPHSLVEVARLVVIFTYLPMLAIVLLRDRPSAAPQGAAIATK